MEKKFRIVDLFCGIGNFRAGFEQAGAVCVYSVEWDKYKRQIYKVIYGREPEADDIRRVCAGDIPEAECWCFGAPCNDFSIAGHREGLNGERSSLVREVFRLIEAKPKKDRPEWLIYENVRGMLSSNKGWDFATILLEFFRWGYDVEWRLLNSKYYNVPQNRERVYLVGHIRSKGSRKVLPSERIIGSNNLEVKQIMRHESNDAYRVYDVSGCSPCLSRAESDRIFVLDDIGIRRLTPKECMRLQGVDDEVTDRLIEAGISDAQLYRASGDAVTIPVVYEIAKRMIEIWEEDQNNG